jgi:phage baseplate assembly protein W
VSPARQHRISRGTTCRKFISQDLAKALLIELCALVQAKVRRWITTFRLRRLRFDLRNGDGSDIAAGSWQRFSG